MNALIAVVAVAVVAIVALISLVLTVFDGTDDVPVPSENTEIIEAVSTVSARVMPESTLAAERPPLVVPMIPDTRAVPDEGDEISFCLPTALPVPDCLTRSAILGLDGRPVDRLTADGTPRFAEVMMVHPTDYQEPERVVRTCEVFARLKSEEWGPMTTAGQAAAARFERFCGLRALAAVAAEPRTTRFTGGQLSEQEIDAVPAGQWPGFGEAASAEPIFRKSEDAERTWSGSTETQLMTIHDVAHADFDGDGEGEMLLHLAARARGGSLGYAGYYIVEHDKDGVGLRRVEWK